MKGSANTYRIHHIPTRRGQQFSETCEAGEADQQQALTRSSNGNCRNVQGLDPHQR